MRKIIHRVARMGGAVGAAAILAGCGLTDVGGSAGAPSTGPPITITHYVPPSVLLAVMNGPTDRKSVV